MENQVLKANEQTQKIIEKVEAAAKLLAEGKMVVLVDDEGRENEGDLVFAAEKTTPELINFMARHGRGLICLALDNAIANRLDLPYMVADNTSTFQTAFTVSIEARSGVTTGISAKDRSHTVWTAMQDNACPGDLARPGHIFPLRAKDGGALVRTGQTEGSVDLARIAGLKRAAVICEIMAEDGSMARMPDLKLFAAEHDLMILSVADIVAYRLLTERLVEQVAASVMPTRNGGDLLLKVFRSKVDGREHLALIKGDISPDEPVMVRVHSECLTGDALGSLRCDCGAQLQNALRMVQQNGHGIILYLRQEGRGIGLTNKIKAYHLQDNGMDTVEANVALGFAADLRDYGIGAQILLSLGVKKVRLITNNPKKLVGISGYGLDVVDQIPNIVGINENNIDYLRTKQFKMGHTIFDLTDAIEKL